MLVRDVVGLQTWMVWLEVLDDQDVQPEREQTAGVEGAAAVSSGRAATVLLASREAQAGPGHVEGTGYGSAWGK